MTASTRSVPLDSWLTVAAAARMRQVSRGSLMAAILRGELKAHCAACHAFLSKVALKDGHLCRLAPTGVERLGFTRFALHLRWRDVKRYSVSPSHHAAGKASARVRAKARRSA